MLVFVGLGLGDAKDITVKGLEVVKKCKRVYLEAYTSILTVGKDALVWISIHDVITLHMICQLIVVYTVIEAYMYLLFLLILRNILLSIMTPCINLRHNVNSFNRTKDSD